MFLNNIRLINHIFDPLEQFEVVPFINLWGLPPITNVALTFFLLYVFFIFYYPVLIIRVLLIMIFY